MGSILRFKDENGNWVSVPALVGPQGREGPVGPQGDTGDMSPSVYDPQGKKQDIFAYVDEVAATVKTRLSRFVTNDISIVPTGQYATATYYNQTYGVKVGYCPDGSILLSMQGGTTGNYENIYFSLASAPAGVAIQTNNNTYDTSGDTGNLFVCWLTGISGKVEISVAMDSYNGTYDYVECAVTVAEASYTEVAYIESAGSAYIDTGIKGQTGISVEGAFMPTTSADAILTGCYGPQRCYLLSISGSALRYGYVDWYTSSKTISAGTRYEYAVDFSANAQSLTVDGVVVASSANTTQFANTSNIFLGAYSDGGPAGDFFTGRIYRTKYRLNGELVRDFVPAVSNRGVYGMFDKLNEQFYTNAGSGSFTGA